MRLDRHGVTTILTLVIVACWIISAVVRIWVVWPEARILDAVMPVCCGYWFLSAAKNGSPNGKAVSP